MTLLSKYSSLSLMSLLYLEHNEIEIWNNGLILEVEQLYYGFTLFENLNCRYVSMNLVLLFVFLKLFLAAMA